MATANLIHPRPSRNSPEDSEHPHPTDETTDQQQDQKKKKGPRVEAGIWKHISGNGYVAEINYTDPQTGKRIREQKTIHRLDLAQQWRQTRKVDALRGEIQRKKDQPKPLLFSDFMDEYLELWSKVKKKTSTYNRDSTRARRLNQTFGEKLLSEITQRDVERYLADRQQEGAGSATRNRELCLLKNALRKAADWGYLRSNPAGTVKQERESPPEFTFLAEEEIDALLANCAPNLTALFTLAIHTGLRRGELFRLEWRDINFETGLITVRDTKNHETRYVPMNRLVREALQRQPRRIVKQKVCPLVFPGPKGELLTTVWKGFAGAKRRAGITRHVRFHDLRHTFASHLTMKGVDLRTVAKLMGHKDIKVTMRYAHLAPEHLQAAVDVLTVRSDGHQRTQAMG